MDLTVTFLIEILFVIVLLGVLVVGALVAYRRRDGTGGANSRTTMEERGREAAREPTDRREFFKSTGPGRNEEVKLRLYSLEEYRGELGGDAPPGGTVAALKAYRRLQDVWLDLPPGQAASALELSPEDYEVDGERGVLLLKRMPPGLPSSAGGL